MLFALEATIFAFIAYIFATVFGMALMPSAVLRDSRNYGREFIVLLSPVLGVAVWIACIVPLGIVLGYTRYLLYAFFVIAFVFIYLRRSRIFIPNTSVYWLFLAIITLLVFVNCCYIAPLEFDGKIYYGSAIYDHIKSAIVDSIAQRGLPPKSPWIADNGVPVNIIYYYGLHAFAAQLPLLFGISGFLADAALVLGFSVFITRSVIMALILKLAEKVALDKPWHKKFLLLAFCLMFIAWRLSLYFALLPQGFLTALASNYCSLGHGYWPTHSNCRWASQHTVAASVVVLVIYLYNLLLANNEKKETKELAILIGIATPAAFMTSVYAGILPFIFLFVALGFVYIAKRDFRKSVNSNITYELCALAIACIIAFPYMMQFFAFVGGSGGAPLEFGIQQSYEGSFGNGLLPFLKYLASFYCVILPKNLGLFYVFGMCFVLAQVFSKKKSNNKHERDRLMLFGELLIISTLIVITFVHSSICMNDFGWRTIEPAVFFLYAFSAICFTKIFVFLYNNKRKLAYVFIAFIAIIQIGTLTNLGDDFLEVHTDFPELRETFVKSVKGWEKVREVTDGKDLVLSNPVAFRNLCYFGDYIEEKNYNYNCVDSFFSCYARRSTPVSAPGYSLCYSINYDQKKLEARFDRIVKFFEGNPPQAEVDYIANDLKVKAILVTPVDGLWKNEGKLNTRYKKVFSTEDYKVFVKQH